MRAVQALVSIGLICCIVIPLISAEPAKNNAKPQWVNDDSDESHNVKVLTQEGRVPLLTKVPVKAVLIKGSKNTKAPKVSTRPSAPAVEPEGDGDEYEEGESASEEETATVKEPSSSRRPVQSTPKPEESSDRVKASKNRNYVNRILGTLASVLPPGEVFVLKYANLMLGELIVEVLELCGSVDREEIPPTPFIDCKLITAQAQAQCAANEQHAKAATEEAVVEFVLTR